VRELDRGNLDAAQSLVSGMTLARSASDEFDAGVQQRLREAEGGNSRTLLNANAGDAQLRAGPAEQDSVVPATRTAFDDDGNLMPGVVDANAAPQQRAVQLAQALERQGLSTGEAVAIAADHLQDWLSAPQPLQAPNSEAARWTPAELQERIDDVERRVQQDLAAQQAREDSLLNKPAAAPPAHRSSLCSTVAPTRR
jgi:uncharacterized protein YoaH (UPF0181 family)